jgi:hypothetical protein
MSDEMTDEQFLSYCDSMTQTDRCGFVPKNIARLLRLAGEGHKAAEWEDEPNRVVSNCHEGVKRAVEMARARLANQSTAGKAE